MRHHDIFGHQGLLLLLLLLLEVAYEDIVQVGRTLLLQCLHEEVLVIDHELLQLLIVEALMLELALVHFAHASPVEILAGELAEIV